MAYDVNTDYKAQNEALKKQLAAATDAATKAALQAQIDANDVSRTQKIASDLTAYGKYATDSELNSAAGLMAQNQIGTTYENQARNIGNYYDTAKQNANNDALSRGMARSTYVSDRMANIDTDRATALTDNDMAKALAIQNAQANILSNYRTNAANQLANEKSDYANNKMTYYDDYQAEINNVLGDGDPTNDWKADALKGWRNQKLLDLEEKAAKTINDNVYTPKTPVIEETDVVKLNDAAASQAVGMNRTATGQLATIQRLYDSDQITEAQATSLINKFNLV